MGNGKAAIGIACVAAAVVVGWLLYVKFVRIPTDVAYVTEEDGAVSVIDLKTLSVKGRFHSQDIAPRGEGVTADGKYLFTANKNTSDATIFDTRRLRPVGRVAVGDNPEFVKLQPGGDWIFTSHEPGSTAGPPAEGGQVDDDNLGPPSQIDMFHVGDWKAGQDFTAGIQTEGLEFSADGKTLIVANEAQNTLGIYDIASGKKTREIDLNATGKRPRGVKRSPRGNGYAVTMEGSGTLALLDPNFQVARSRSTAAKPYGVAFDRSGDRIFVAAAAAQKLQVYRAADLQLLSEVPIGKRCWHFTFSPDDSKILLACGRSNDVYVIDAASLKTIKVLTGFQTPWGIVTYPHSYGSLDLP
jgi:YVTN family beta-propeller protein